MSYKAIRKPFLSQRHKSARLQWCKDHRQWTVDDWSKVIWSDETKIQLYSTSGQTVVRCNKRDCFKEHLTQKTQKFGLSVMVGVGLPHCQGVGAAESHRIEPQR